MKKHTINKDNFFQLISVLIIVLLCCVNIEKLNYIAVLNDEFGYWGNAVSLAGYDWSSLIAETPYYAMGYSIFLVPFVILFSSPEIWYKLAIFLNILFLVVSYFLCCGFGQKIFPKVDKKYIYIISCLVIIYPGNILYAQVAWTESLLYFLMWLATYLMVCIEEKFSYKKLIVIICTFVYMYFVHARTIGIIAIGIICLCLILCKNKKNIFHFFSVPFLFLVGYLLITKLKGWQISELWANSAASDLNNVALDQNTISQYVLQILANFKLFFESLGGKLIYLVIGSGVVFFIPCFVWVKELLARVKTKSHKIEYGIIKFWCVGSIIAMWGISSLQMMYWSERKDIIVYSRYMENALGPILFLGIVYAVTKVAETRQGSVLAAVILLIGLRSVYYRVNEAEGELVGVCSPVISAFYEWMRRDVNKTFLWLAAFAGASFLILMISTFFKKEKHKVYLVFGWIFISFVFIGVKSGIYMNGARENFDGKTIPIKEEIRNQVSDRKIYYVKNTETDPYSVNPKYLQFQIPRESISLIDIDELSDVTHDNELVLVNPKDVAFQEYNEQEQQFECIAETHLLKLYKYK